MLVVHATTDPYTKIKKALDGKELRGLRKINKTFPWRVHIHIVVPPTNTKKIYCIAAYIRHSEFTVNVAGLKASDI
ncbi:hypothetical protein BC938DRAFT_481135 [Jimgerdemannia flammicorona]|uniref:Uncharacterized protein n=1 Tax=Jimgerdemannia flammicorona TaxID=994334 RepID=A0A433QGV9_9FUNG|nr:hypothetical protein BC938DRAFT_481135 [Jimgerdemannia flammicorona]